VRSSKKRGETLKNLFVLIGFLFFSQNAFSNPDLVKVATCENEQTVFGLAWAYEPETPAKDIIFAAGKYKFELFIYKNQPRKGKFKSNSQLSGDFELEWNSNWVWFDIKTHDGRTVKTVFYDGQDVVIPFTVDADGEMVWLFRCHVWGLSKLSPQG